MKKTGHSLQSPLGKVRGYGSAKTGVAQWLDLRLVAVALIPLTLYVVISFTNSLSGGYSAMLAWVQSPVSATVVILTLLAGFRHGAAGLKEVIEDYVHLECAKIGTIFVVNFIAVALTILGTLSVAKIFFGV
ncbi:MAG: succinate dehydrogenase, hydrophobic membrane anchor protein [Alphaproteobacteria bacterium]|nr:succinate dehydrogenase, hydrophobic membrane anchor protein [Alphaproteobacteria bacterium]